MAKTEDRQKVVRQKESRRWRTESTGGRPKGVEAVEDGVEGRQARENEKIDGVESRQATVSEKMEDGSERRQARGIETK